MTIEVGPRDIDVPAHEQLAPLRAYFTYPVGEPRQELQLRGIVLPAVRDIDRRDYQVVDFCLHDARFDVERRVTEYRIGGDQVPANQKRHARIALAAVPVRVILDEVARLRDLRAFGLQFLQTFDVRPLALEPLPHLGRTRPDAVDIPGGDFHLETFPSRLPRISR